MEVISFNVMEYTVRFLHESTYAVTGEPSIAGSFSSLTCMSTRQRCQITVFLLDERGCENLKKKKERKEECFKTPWIRQEENQGYRKKTSHGM